MYNADIGPIENMRLFFKENEKGVTKTFDKNVIVPRSPLCSYIKISTVNGIPTLGSQFFILRKNFNFGPKFSIITDNAINSIWQLIKMAADYLPSNIQYFCDQIGTYEIGWEKASIFHHRSA
jgi:hypothetical protein